MSQDPIVEAYWRGRFDESGATRNKIRKVVETVFFGTMAIALFPITIPICLWTGGKWAIEHIKHWIWARKHPTEAKRAKEKAEAYRLERLQREQEDTRCRAYGRLDYVTLDVQAFRREMQWKQSVCEACENIAARRQELAGLSDEDYLTALLQIANKT